MNGFIIILIAFVIIYIMFMWEGNRRFKRLIEKVKLIGEDLKTVNSGLNSLNNVLDELERNLKDGKNKFKVYGKWKNGGEYESKETFDTILKAAEWIIETETTTVSETEWMKINQLNTRSK